MQIYNLRNYRKESLAILGCSFLSKTFLTGWMIYSMVHYFSLSDEEESKCKGYWPMFLYFAYGFFILMQA
jgi:hypothetical protein